MIDEDGVDEPTAKEAAMECIDRLRKVYSLEKRTRELLVCQNVPSLARQALT